MPFADMRHQMINCQTKDSKLIGAQKNLSAAQVFKIITSVVRPSSLSSAATLHDSNVDVACYFE